MNICSFNEGWKVRRLDSDKWEAVTVPHDAMLQTQRSNLNPGRRHIAWFEGADYVYIKEFPAPREWEDLDVTFEFEGVYHNAEVYLNGRKLVSRPYGYTNFYVDVTKHLHFGQINELRVVAHNADQPNSRWYTGSGIFRPVNLYLQKKQHIEINGVKIRTLSLDPVAIEFSVTASCCGNVQVEITDGTDLVHRCEISCDPVGKQVIRLPDAKLWSPEHPHLYRCRLDFEGDVQEHTFGIRMVEATAEKGFCLNGQRVILRGACIHGDNGLLGACAFPEAEERKIRILKECGYNAIRSSHHPCSKALLDACDRLGMLVLDEYVDMWYSHKTMFDYAGYFQEWYEQDIRDMIDKDHNHPSVVMYSIGNEVCETAEERGIQLTKTMTDLIHALDATRPVTVAINIFFNMLWGIGQPIFSDEKSKRDYAEALGGFKPKTAFEENLGPLMTWFDEMNMKVCSSIFLSDWKTKDSFANVDIAGYNYGIFRYKIDMKKYPRRIILGSESYLHDTYDFWELAKQYPAVIGDFVWTGMDYLGEIAIGAWEYKEYAKDFNRDKNWLTAGCGRVDITGKPRAEMAYTRVIFELEDKPQIAVLPVSGTGMRSAGTWGITNAIESWSWNGLDGKEATVEVYSRAPQVELQINGLTVGVKKPRKCRCVFKTVYHSGEICAIARDNQGRELSRNALKTAAEETVLQVLPEKTTVKSGELAYVRLRYTDREGNWKPVIRERISVQVHGGDLVALGHACPYNPDGYLQDSTDTYYGEALAIVRATGEDTISVCANSRSYKSSALIFVENCE